MLKERKVEMSICSDDIHCGKSCLYFEDLVYFGSQEVYRCSLFQTDLNKDESVQLGNSIFRANECLTKEID